MARFWKRDDQLGGLEQQLRTQRPEPTDEFLHSLKGRFPRIGSRTQWFEPRARYMLLAVLTAAVLAAAASAGGLHLATTSSNNAFKVVQHLTDSSHHSSGNDEGNGNGNNGNNGNGNGNGDDHGNGNGNGNGDDQGNGDDHDHGFPGPPGHDQYKGQCGLPPRKRCNIQVAPQRPRVNAGQDVFITVSLKAGDVSDGSVSVNYSTQNGTAVAGTDYQAASGTLAFPFGTNAVTFVIHTTAAGHYKKKEFFVNFSSSTAFINPADSQITVTLDGP